MYGTLRVQQYTYASAAIDASAQTSQTRSGRETALIPNLRRDASTDRPLAVPTSGSTLGFDRRGLICSLKPIFFETEDGDYFLIG